MKRDGASVDLAYDVRWIHSFTVSLRRWILHITILTFLLFSPFGVETAAGPSGLRNQVSRTGRLTLTWGDGRQGSGLSTLLVSLVDESGETTVLEIEPQSLGNIYGLNRRRVVAVGRWVEAPGLAKQVLRVNSLQLDGSSESSTGLMKVAALSGPQPWVNLLCKFADLPSEPETLSYFNGLLGEAKPGLGHYWREVSYDQINIMGSDSYGWYTLPKTRTYYLGLATSTMLTELFADCTAAADKDIYFPDFVGINLMFNVELEGSAWGGSRFSTLDGQRSFWYTTWEPPWGYHNQAVMAHEMGHGFGLPHSSGAYGLTYDNEWDVMSDNFANCSRSTDPTYGCLAQHTISYHKDMLGWFIAGQRNEAVDGTQTITLEQLALPETGNYRMAMIPIDGSATNFYTVEVRNWAGYDVKLPGEAVIIHEVDTNRSRPANVVDIDGDGDTGDEGAMWIVGETFTDVANSITVSIDSETVSGFVVTITLGEVPPTATPTTTPTETPTETPTNTPTDTPTYTPVPPTATLTDTPTNTPMPPTDTPTNTATNTPMPPTTTLTSTPLNTPVTPTVTLTNTPTKTATATSTRTPIPTATTTPSPTATITPSRTLAATESPTPSATATSEFEPEDINQDGMVDMLDVQLCIDVLYDLETDLETVALADVNGDGMVNTLDVQAIVNAYLYEESLGLLNN